MKKKVKMKKKVFTTLFVTGLTLTQALPVSAQEPVQEESVVDSQEQPVGELQEEIEVESQTVESMPIENEIQLLSDEVYPTSITLLSSVKSFMVQGDTATIKVNGYAPSNVTDKNVIWSSSDTNVATVNSEGVITAVGAGNVTITATCVGKNPDMTSPATATFSFYVKGIADNYQYKIDNGTITIEKYLGSDTNIVIPSTINGMPVKSIGSYAFAFSNNAKSITSVTIPYGVTQISDYAFNACTALSKVSIPSTVKTIGKRAFWSTALISVTIPNGVISIGNEAFSKCASLTSVSLPASLTSVGANAFNGTKLSSLTLPDNISYVGTNAFSGITLYANPESTTYKTLTSKKIEVKVKYPTSISITTDSKTVTGKNKEIVQGNTAQFYVNSYSFESTVHDVIWSVDNEEIGSIDSNGVVTIKNEGTLKVIATCTGKNEDMTSPAQAEFTLTCIGVSGSFQYKTKEDGTILIDEYIGTDKDVQIPSTIDGKPVTEIYNAFYGDENIESVVIPEGVTVLDKEAFALCKNLSKVTLPSTLKTIGERAFAYTNLKEVIIPEGVTSIGRNAFNNCKQMTNISLPSTLKTINPLAFTSTGLKEIVLPDHITYIGTNALKGIDTILVKFGTETEQTLKENNIPYSIQWVSLNSIPVIECKDIVLKEKDSFDPLKDVKAMDAEDGDLTVSIEIVENDVDTSKVGEYKVIYKVVDSNGAICTKTRKVIVEKKDNTENTKTETKKNTKKEVKTGFISSFLLYLSLFLSSLASLFIIRRNKSK